GTVDVAIRRPGDDDVGRGGVIRERLDAGPEAEQLVEHALCQNLTAVESERAEPGLHAAAVRPVDDAGEHVSGSSFGGGVQPPSAQGGAERSGGLGEGLVEQGVSHGAPRRGAPRPG
ncbi:MAG: hypothetical protein QOH66_2545, partial [Actinomycetota bacterium]|nr:hypothetical protein [Actinomycetota bacterium]